MSDGCDHAPHAPRPTAKKDPIPLTSPRCEISCTSASVFATGAAVARQRITESERSAMCMMCACEMFMLCSIVQRVWWLLSSVCIVFVVCGGRSRKSTASLYKTQACSRLQAHMSPRANAVTFLSELSS